MKSRLKGWKLYELFVARLMVAESSTDLCVTPNARVKGTISGRSRQIDVLIDRRHDTDNSRRVVVDAKRRRRKIDVVQVEAFKGLMDDVGARHGYLICPVGHTKAAEKRAQQSITIRLISLDGLAHFDPSKWDRCRRKGCNRGFIFWDGYPELSMEITPIEGGLTKNIPFIHSVGKCDRCGRFHVRCLTCQELFSLDNDSGDHQCRCNPPWFWLASVEQDKHGHRSAELHVVMRTGKVITVDRRPM